MAYFSGSLLNPQVPGGKDNRNKTPFDQYFPDMSRPAPQAGQMSAPRNEAFQLLPILNPSASYRAFAEPKMKSSPYMGFIRHLKKGFWGRSPRSKPDIDLTHGRGLGLTDTPLPPYFREGFKARPIPENTFTRHPSLQNPLPYWLASSSSIMRR